MGVSTNVYLFFGFHLDEETWNQVQEAWGTTDMEEYEEWEDIYAQRRGLDRPTAEYSESAKAQYSEYWRQRDELVDKCPGEIVFHCSDDFPLPFIALRGTVETARRGYPKKVKVFDVPKEQAEALKSFCELMDIPWPKRDELGWYIASYWG